MAISETYRGARPMTHIWKHSQEAMSDAPGWQGEAGALLGWARWSVDSLFYLADLDQRVVVKDPGPHEHAWHVVDLAHARWAAGSAIGALDLCAAAASRRLGCGPKITKRGDREFDLADLAAEVGAGTANMAGPLADWVQRTEAKSDVQLLTAVRHPMTHRRLIRHFDRGGGGSERTHLEVEGTNRPLDISEIVRLARDAAVTAVEELFDLIATGGA